MAEKMLRVAGRGADGTAKALQTDNQGNLNAKNVGSNLSRDIDMSGIVIAPGQTHWLPRFVFAGSRIGIGIHFDKVAKFKVITRPMNLIGQALDDARVIIDQTQAPKNKASISHQLLTSTNEIGIINAGAEGISVIRFNITDFMTEGAVERSSSTAVGKMLTYAVGSAGGYALGSQPVKNGVTVIAHPNNVGAVYVYPKDGTKVDVVPLYAGDSDFWEVRDVAALKFEADTFGDSVYWKGVI